VWFAAASDEESGSVGEWPYGGRIGDPVNGEGMNATNSNIKRKCHS